MVSNDIIVVFTMNREENSHLHIRHGGKCTEDKQESQSKEHHIFEPNIHVSEMN